MLNTIFVFISLLSISASANYIKISPIEIHALMAGVCSLHNNHISRIKPTIQFNFHRWEIYQDSASEARVRGECSIGIRSVYEKTIEPGDKFDFIFSKSVTNNYHQVKWEMEKALGFVNYIKSVGVNKQTRNLEDSWQLHSITLFPMPAGYQWAKDLPIVKSLINALKPHQQTNYSFEKKVQNQDQFSYRFQSIVDLHTMDIFSISNNTIQVNMGTKPEFEWGQVTQNENSDAFFFVRSQNAIGCSNFTLNRREPIKAENCQSYLEQFKNLK